MDEVQSRILCFETVDILKRYHVQFCGGDTIDDRKIKIVTLIWIAYTTISHTISCLWIKFIGVLTILSKTIRR